MARTGQFRGDLLYRLQGITIVIPPLRERRDEIPGLARQAVTAFCLRNDLPEKALAEPVLDMLMEYPWPGNVRELIHALERACLAAGEGDLILPGHLPTQMRVAVARHRVSRGREQSPEPVPPPARTLPAAHAQAHHNDNRIVSKYLFIVPYFSSICIVRESASTGTVRAAHGNIPSTSRP
jgi:two-component system NtrC family response regulator